MGTLVLVFHGLAPPSPDAMPRHTRRLWAPLALSPRVERLSVGLAHLPSLGVLRSVLRLQSLSPRDSLSLPQGQAGPCVSKALTSLFARILFALAAPSVLTSPGGDVQMVWCRSLSSLLPPPPGSQARGVLAPSRGPNEDAGGRAAAQPPAPERRGLRERLIPTL